MKIVLEDQQYNTRLETSDWRYSASIVGLIKFFEYHKSMGFDIDYESHDDFIEYNREDITEERYLQFAEYYFSDYMHHKIVEQILSSENLSEEQISLINEKLKANSSMKKIFGKTKFTGDNREEILKIIDDNRFFLIKDTYRNGKKMYAKFANSNKFFSEDGKVCRLLNYYIDVGKKGRSIAYDWNYDTYDFKDEIEFDFIPFSFSKSREAFFINSSYSVDQLMSTNNKIEQSENPRSTLFEDLKDSSIHLDYDVEVITKNIDNDYFETLHIRKGAIKVFEKINSYKAIKFNYKVNDNLYINFEEEVTNRILNGIRLDSLIDMLLKDNEKHKFKNRIKTLIKINSLIISGGGSMDDKMRRASGSAKEVIGKIDKNKVISYRQKLISSLVIKDYDKFCSVLLQLSSYSGVVFGFAHDLFEDFDKNKNLAYTFVNVLNEKKKGGKNDD